MAGYDATLSANNPQQPTHLPQEILNLKIQHYRQALAAGQEIELLLRGNSMCPFLRSGSTVLVRSVPWADIHVGDIVLTYDEGIALCHRVIFKSEIRLRTKADALFGWDKPSGPDQIVGKVVGRVKGGQTRRTEGPTDRALAKLIIPVAFILSIIFTALRSLRRVLR